MQKSKAFNHLDKGAQNIISIDKTSEDQSTSNNILMEGDNNIVNISKGSTIRDSLIYMVGSSGKIYIGENCNLAKIQLVCFSDCVINIGKKLHWTTGTARAEDGGVITTGDDCLFSEQIMIRTSDGHAIFDAQNMERINPTRNVYIENYVWLCYGASVGKGCRVGTGTVVGQNAMAFGNLDRNSIYAGSPARKIRSNIIWSANQTISGIPEKVSVHS